MPIVNLPDGNKVDLGDNPSPDVVNHIHDVIDQQTKAGVRPAATGAPLGGGTVLGEKASELVSKAREYAPTIARTAGPLVGGAAGFAVGGPPGAAAGAALGGTVGDVAAQALEIHRGERKTYNPLRTAAEAGTDAIWAGVPMGDAIMTAVAKAGTFGVISSNAISMADGQGVNTLGQDAIAFLTAGGLQGVSHYLGGWGAHDTSGAKDAAVKEISGVPQIEEHVNVLTQPDAPTHGPDGVPTEIPGAQILDEFGKPISKQASYPIKAEQVTPEGGIETPTVTGGRPEGKAGKEPPKVELTAAQKNAQKQAVFDTWMEQRRPGIFEATPSKDIPPLDHVTEPLYEPDGGMEDLKQQASDPIHDIPGNGEFDDPSEITQSVMERMGRTKTYFQRLENETQYPVYQDYDQLSQANRKYQAAKKEMSGAAGKALKGTDRGDWSAMLQDAYGGNDGQSLQPKLRSKYQSLMGVFDKALEPFDLSSHELLGEYVQAVVDNDQDVLSDPKFGKLQDALIQGKVNLETTDLPRMAQQITNMGAFEQHAGPTVNYLKNKYSASLDAPDQVKQAINYYTNVLDGTPDRLAKAVGAIITDTGKKFGWNVDGRGIANRLVTSQYAATLAGRPGPIIRRLLHPMQTAAGPMGFSWLAEGYRQMATNEGRQLVQNSGIAADTIMDELATPGKTLVGRTMDKGISWLMAPFGKADLLSRGPVYLGQRAKTLWAAAKYGDDMEKFLTKSGVGRMSPQEADIIKGLMSQGNVEEAANRSAEMMNDNTQFMYSQLERPRVLTGTGRSIGGFGVWPMQYGGYLARMMQRGANGTWYEVGRDLTRFLAANSALVGGFYGAAKFVNDKTALDQTLGWSFVSHIAYTGSPLISSLLAAGKDLHDTMGGRPPKGAEVWRDVAAPNIPLAGLGTDVYRASKEPTPERAAAYYTGISRTPLSKGGIRGLSSKPLKGF